MKSPRTKTPPNGPDPLPEPSSATVTGRTRLLHGLLVTLLAMGIYGNTINHQFALDDVLFIHGNTFTQAGFEGLADIWTTDPFIGAYGETIKLPGGRYRPLSISTFAIEYELFGPKAGDSEHMAQKRQLRLMQVMHGGNIVLYGLSALLIYLTLLKLFRTRNGWLALVATLLYVVHPLHTEVIANIKSRDEILGVLFVVATLNLFLSRSGLVWLLGIATFLLALLSKESTITALAFIPLAIGFIGKQPLKNTAIKTASLLVITAAYLMLRARFTEGFDEVAPTNVMDAPFLYATGVEKWATIIFVAGKYLWMQFVPHPLSYDYTWNVIPYTNFGDWRVWTTIVAYTSMIGYAGWNLLQAARKKAAFSPIALGIIWYVAAFSIVSNVFFNIGAPMGERFMYLPGLGMCIAMAAGLERLLKLNTTQPLVYSPKWLVPVAALVLLGSVATVARNPAWEHNYTLYTADVETVPNSCRTRLFLGITLLNKHYKKANAEQLDMAIEQMEAATRINPDFVHAFYNLGLGYQARNDHELAIGSFERALEIAPLHINSHYYLGLSYGKGRGDLAKAIEFIEKGLKYGYNGADGYVNLGTSYGMQGDYANALDAFLKAVPSNGNNAQLHFNIAVTYDILGQPEQAIPYRTKAFELNPALQQQAQ